MDGSCGCINGQLAIANDAKIPEVLRESFAIAEELRENQGEIYRKTTGKLWESYMAIWMNFELEMGTRRTLQVLSFKTEEAKSP